MQLPELLLAASAWLATSGGALAIDPPDIIGEAADRNSGQLLYLELHYCDDQQLQCTVLYVDNAGEPLARKQLDYSASPQAPSVQVKDLRTEWEFSADMDDYQADYVVDAGFDNFIRSQWQQFEQGETVRFPLLVAGRDKALSMRAETVSGCASEELCLQVEADSWLLRALLDPIELTYDRDRQRLLRYRGISNLRGESGRNPEVDISYSYAHQDGSSPR